MRCANCGSDVACTNAHDGGDGGCGCIWGIGSGIAGVLSWSRFHSVLWAGIHGILSWLYIAYRYFGG